MNEKMLLTTLAYLNPSTKVGIIKAILKDYHDQYSEHSYSNHDSSNVEKQQQGICMETINVLVGSLESEIGFTDLLNQLQE